MTTDGIRPEEHLCLDCGVDISHRRRDAQRCEPCSYTRTKKRSNDYYRENRPSVLQRIKSQQQTPEAKQLRHKWTESNPQRWEEYRRHSKAKHREETGYNPEGRTCEKCGADISDRGHRAKRCVSCSTPPAKVCIVCGADISHKRGNATFCSEQCKIDDRQSKELMGSTKVCTKCKETKEYSEFRMHYSVRGSVCKRCKANSAQEYYQDLPVEERQNRRRVQGQREREKRANLSPEEKAAHRTKVRNTRWRKLYGADFDADKLYLDQGGKCALCKTPKSLEEMEVDHRHGTDQVRGLLCKNCNFKLVSQYEKFSSERQDSPYLNAYLSRGKAQ